VTYDVEMISGIREPRTIKIVKLMKH